MLPPTPLRVLYLEDSPEDVKLLTHELLRAGFDPSCETVFTREHFLAHLDPKLDLILSDFTMPGFNGLEALRLMNERKIDIPFIFVSGTIGEETAVTAMLEGAADYLMKDRLARLGPAVKQALARNRLKDEKLAAEQMTAHLAAIVESSSDAIMTKTLDGAITSWNAAAVRLYGYSANEILGKHVSILFPLQRRGLEPRENFQDEVQRLSNGEDMPAMETVRVRKDGRRIEVLENISPLRGMDGVLTGVSATGHDVTERKRSERFLKAVQAVSAILTENRIIDEAGPKVLKVIAECLRWEVASLWLVDRKLNVLRRLHVWHSPFADAEFREALNQKTVLKPGEGVAGRIWSTGEANWKSEEGGRSKDYAGTPSSGMRCGFGLPMRQGKSMVGVIEFYNPELREFDKSLVAALDNVASQISQFIERGQSELDLRESEERNRVLIETIPHVVWMTRPDGQVTYLNQNGARYLGIPAEEFNGLGWLELLHPDDQDRTRQMWEACVRNETPYRIEYRVRQSDGTYRWNFAQGAPQRGTGGAIENWVGTWTDIEDRKIAEVAMQVSERRFRSLIENSWDNVTLIDAQGRILYSSPATIRLLGYSPGQLVGRNGAELIHPDEAAGVMEVLTRLVANPGESVTATCRMLHKNGSWRWMETAATNLLADPHLRGCVLNSHDVTDQKKSLEALRMSEDRFRNLIMSLPAAVFTTDREGRLTLFNDCAVKLWGRQPDVENDRWHGACKLFRPDGTSMPLDHSPLARTLREGRAVRGEEIVIERPDGSRSSVLPHPELLRGPSGEIVGAVNMLIDVTQMKLLEEQFRQAQKMEAIGRLAGGVAHDFNNLLTVINGYGEMMLRSFKEGDRNREPIKEIIRAGERATALTRQLLAFSRQQVVCPQVLNLNALLADSEKMLRRLIGEDLELKTIKDPALGNIKADPGQLEQVLLNLAVNARDAMPHGGKVTLSTQNVDLGAEQLLGHSDNSPGPYVLLTFGDNGCGMDRSTLARIFEPFFTTKGTKGTGLGLATVFGIVKQSQGKIEVASEPGRGATFKIYLPCVSEPISSAYCPPNVPVSLRGSETILVAEDEEGVRTLTRHVLEENGYTVLVATSGAEAIRICEKLGDTIDVLLADVVMPGMSGRELADQLIVRWPDIKLLYVSGYTDDAVIRYGVHHDLTHFLQKPFSPLGLALKVREVLNAI